jgi:F0F1-type ATP synthase membrane subunit b/b'
MKQFFIFIIIAALVEGCQNGSEKSDKGTDRREKIEYSVDSAKQFTHKALGNVQAVQAQLWAQYDSIREIRQSIPDSIAHATSREERYYYNTADGKLEHIQSDIRNQSDSILLSQLKLHVSDLADVIVTNEANLRRLENFTRVLKKITFGISQATNLATAKSGIPSSSKK